MAYIGNTNTTQAFTAAVDYFSGNASTTSFTLSRPVAASAQVQAVIENVPQNPSTAFTVSSNTITFTSAPPSGTNNIYVYYTSPITQVIQPSQGTVGAVQLDTGNGGAGTGSVQLPSGTTAQRPSSTTPGQVRYNSSNLQTEFYQNSAWQAIPFIYSIEFLLVAGGGAGSGDLGGGGGAGGYIDSTLSVTSGTDYSIVIGAGGAAQTGNNQNSNSGSNSTAFGSTSVGGGGSGGEGNFNGKSGGSGGAAGYSGSAGSATSGQGNAGGTGSYGGVYPTGGGGGAGAAGSNGSGTVAGGGGNGLNWKSLGNYYAGGGGGCTYPSGAGTRGAGGLGGGGSGVSTTGQTGIDGTANTGGGGGGQGASDGGTGGAGGSGICIIRYAGAQRGTGGTYSSSGGYSYHTFTSSGTYTA